jgi:hypothetical protein
MNIIFSNIVKNNLPLLVNTSCLYEDYFLLLTTSSKRFLNLSYRKYNEKITTVLDYTITKNDLKFISNEGKVGLANLLIENNKAADFKPHWFVKYYDNGDLISYNHISLTKSEYVLGYCNCFFVFSEKFSDKIFNIFSWFKFIELIIKNKLANVIDLVVDRDLYQYQKIRNGMQYNINDIKTSREYLQDRKKSSGGFNNANNSSKFLFLTKQDKCKKDNLISVVCTCGHKTLLETTKQQNVCYSCKDALSILI